jgi:hypothetical protein
VLRGRAFLLAGWFAGLAVIQCGTDGAATSDRGGGGGALNAGSGAAGSGGSTAFGGGGAGGTTAAQVGGASAGGGAGGSGGVGAAGVAGTGGTTGVGGKGTGGAAGGSCDPGKTATAWATGCPTSPPSCAAGTWMAGGPDPDHAGFKLISESAHFAIYSDEAVSIETAQLATDTLENAVWSTYFGAPIYFKEPLCNSATKTKASIHVHSDWGLTGGAWTSTRMGMWIGTGALSDHWGLAHEFMHAVQAVSGGMSCDSSNTCGWIHESHANFMPHQLREYASNVHCTEMLVNAPHLYLGSTRDRYCNWQFLEYLKDRYCFSAVNAIWTSTPSDDPFKSIMDGRGWGVSDLNDFFGEWAMHNVSWDYLVSGAAMRTSYGPITDTSRTERRLRLTRLEPLDANVVQNRRFVSPYLWAPQRWGYNVVRLAADSGAASVTVRFRGVVQSAANSDWRWGLVATTPYLTNPRYSALQRGADGQLTFCVGSGESVWLVVVGAPAVFQTIVWDQEYASIYRYPYMVELANAWPEGQEGGAPPACPSGLVRVANGGGCGPANLPSSVYVGPFAAILGGTVSANARIEDHARVINGVVSGGTVGGLTLVGMTGNGRGFNVSASATAKTTFYPLGFFESGQSLAGTAVLFGDVEYRGDGAARTSGSCSGFVDTATCLAVGADVTAAPPYVWRQ